MGNYHPIALFGEMERVATEGYSRSELRIHTPFVHIGKHAIVTIGARLGIPYEETWSCYKGGEKHCGACGTCYERREAFELAGIPDQTEYESRPHFELGGA